MENDDKKGVDVVRKLVPLLLITLLLAGCVGGTQVKIAELEWEYPSGYLSTGYLRGTVKNTGRVGIRYMEIGVQLKQNGVVVASGWTNLTRLAPGEERAFKIIVFDFPPGEFEYQVFWSTSPGGVPM